MAILNKIRQRGLFLVIIIAMALFSFVFADLFNNSSGFSDKSQTVIATVNGKDIDRDDFMERVESFQRQSGGRGSNTQAMNQVWDQEIRYAVMESQYDALGLKIERDKMRDLLKLSISSFEEFLNSDGIYDEDKLNEFIANLKQISPETMLLNGTPINYEAWANFEKNISDGGRQQTYLNLVKAGVIGTLAEGELDYKLENDKVDIKFVQIPFSSIPDSTITVKTSDITNYINKNKSKYEVKASRDIHFVQFKEVASLEDEANIQNDLKVLLENRVEYNSNSQSNDTITGFLNTNDNDAFVNANSAIKYNANYVFKSGLPTSVADSIFNLNTGEYYGPYKDGAFFKLSKVVEVKQLPDSVKVRHILIPFIGGTRADATVTKTDVEAKATADSIYTAIKSKRSTFVSLLDLSSDKVSNEKNGEIEFAYQASMAPEFKNFSFENNKGDLQVVKTSFGYHIIEILEQKNKQRAIKVATIAHAIEPSEQTIDKTFNETSKFEIAVADQDFETVAKEGDYTVKPVSNIGVLDENIPGLGNQRPIVRWAFEEGTEIGDVRRFNVLDGGYVVVKLVGINKEGLMTTEKASVTALPEVRKQKKAELIKARITTTTIEDIAASENQTVQTALAINMKSPTLSGAGREPKVIGIAFGLAEGETSKLIEGVFGIYVVQVTKVNPADALPNYQGAANRVEAAKTNEVNDALYEALKNASKIEDNRATFY